ncbi:hypothetical protein [Streptomyces sp. NPDC057702]|uniref:hypothetical protein n=1 Tax=unclassified Streptomyces TaxID=2593676 RepID=UPI0036780408
MTRGDERRRRALRIWLSGADTGRDVAALRAWLEREQPLEKWAREGTVRIETRTAAATDDGGHPMGGVVELLVFVLGELGESTLYDAVKRGIASWRENRGRVEGGAPPEVGDEWTDDASDHDAEGEE